MFVESCEVMDVRLVDVGVMVLELHSSVGCYFCFELGGVKEWIFGRVVSIVDATGGFLKGC